MRTSLQGRVSLGALTSLGGALAQGGGVAPIVPPYPAPSGYEWAFVIENENRVVENGNRVIELKRAA